MKLCLLIFLLLTITGPLVLIFSGKIDFAGDYRTANRDSAHLAPDPNKTTEAVIQVYAARTFNWRGIFAVHTWLAVKPKHGKQYTVYQLIGWRLYHHLSPVVALSDIPDRNWFDHKPHIILDIRGIAAEKIIPKITQAVQSYPYPMRYHYWPGPNSNTFIAYIARQIPEMQLALPSNAVGKDYLTDAHVFELAPSGTGYQFSLYGLLGIIWARKEGLEINILGLVYGFNPYSLTLKLPGFGDIDLKH